jgi:hypothetical protein
MWYVLKWIWVTLGIGIVLGLTTSGLFQLATTGKKILIAHQTVTFIQNYWGYGIGFLLFLGGLTFWAWRQEKERQQQLANDTATTTPPPAASITADTDIDKQVINQTATTAVQSLHQLPPAPRDFTGREAELDTFTNERNERGLALSGLQGMGGVGKTALGLVMAHSIKGHYPNAAVVQQKLDEWRTA